MHDSRAQYHRDKCPAIGLETTSIELNNVFWRHTILTHILMTEQPLAKPQGKSQKYWDVIV